MEAIPTVVVESVDYTPALNRIESLLELCAERLVLLDGFLLFFVVVALCWFAYKFFRIFI